MFTLLTTLVLTFFLGYSVTHYSLSSWSVKSPVAIVVGVLVGVFAAVFATLAVSPLVGL